MQVWLFVVGFKCINAIMYLQLELVLCLFLIGEPNPFAVEVEESESQQESDTDVIVSPYHNNSSSADIQCVSAIASSSCALSSSSSSSVASDAGNSYVEMNIAVGVFDVYNNNSEVPHADSITEHNIVIPSSHQKSFPYQYIPRM